MTPFHPYPGRFIALALLALLTLTGCYVTDEPIIENGQYANVAGKFNCRDRMMGRTQVMEFSEQKEGFLFPAYTYVAGNNIYKFLDIGNNILLAQEQNTTRQVVGFVFVKLIGGDIIIMVPNVTSKAPTLEAMMRANHLRSENRSNGDQILLVGSKNDQLTFLKKHTPDLLMELAVCSRA